VIPKDSHKLIGALKELDMLGVRYLNLQETTLTSENAKGFTKAGYLPARKKGTFALKGSLSVASYMAQYIKRHNLKLTANICSLRYKTYEQTQLILGRMGKLNK
jgi:pyruvate formate-lyase activating enzyme-like uncharacterized protein